MFTVTYKGLVKRDNRDCYQWLFNINGSEFEYFTGLGHSYKTRLGTLKPKVPKIRDVLYALAIDANCASESFKDFCSEFGYSEDSRKALETYLKCQDNGFKLRRCLKSDNAIQRIMEWEL